MWFAMLIDIRDAGKCLIENIQKLKSYYDKKKQPTHFLIINVTYSVICIWFVVSFEIKMKTKDTVCHLN